MKKYEDSRFSFEYPDRWEDAPIGDGVFALRACTDSPVWPKITMLVSEEAAGVSPSQIVAEDEAKEMRLWKGCEKLSKSEREWGGSLAVELLFRTQHPKGISMKYWKLCTVRGEEAHILTFSCPEDEFEHTSRDFQMIIDSFIWR